jgi:hypothetical protein
VEEALHAVPTGRLQEHVNAQDVGLNECAGVHQRAVDVRLGGEVDDGVGVTHRLFDPGGVADVTMDEAIARVVLDVETVVEVTGVGQQIKIDNLPAWPLTKNQPYEIRADKSRPSRHQKSQS